MGFLKVLVLIPMVMLSQLASADFGEIDLIVQESVENFFNDNQRSVEMSTLKYFGQTSIVDGVVSVQSRVWAVQGFTGAWAWHDCNTTLKILGRGRYHDEGSDCRYDWE